MTSGNGRRGVVDDLDRRIPVLRFAHVSRDQRPQLFVVVDTEEEFDWNAPYSRANTAVSAMRHIGRVQTIFDRFGVRPTYVIDYPVASQPEGYQPLLEIAAQGRCDIGAHVHPWVSPPHDEPVNAENSFMMNLAPSLQRAKIDGLRRMIEERFGAAPVVFKAGRYGLDATSAAILTELGFKVDTSICPTMDFRATAGPDFSDYDWRPFFITDDLLEVPCTVAFTGWARGWGPRLHRLASIPALSGLKGIGILARLGVVNKIMLSPEGNRFDEMRLLARSLFRAGCRTFTLSFHSPSVAVGHTPYVQSQSELDGFLRDIERVLEFFMRDLNALGGRLIDFHTALRGQVQESH